MIQESKEPVNLFDSHKQLQDIIDTNHPLVQLADSIDWESIEEELSEAYPSTTGHPNKFHVTNPQKPDYKGITANNCYNKTTKKQYLHYKNLAVSE